MTHPLLRRVAAVSVCALMAHVAIAADENPWTAAPDPAAAPVPQWIWAKNDARDNESENFRVTFDAKIPATKMTEDPSSALLWVAGDDDVTVHLNGKPVAKASRRTGSGATLADVRAELVHGTNVLTVTCRNTHGPAGVAVKLVVRGSYRNAFTLVSDASWTVSDDAPKGWRSKNFAAAADKFSPVRVIGPYGMDPWGKVVAEPPSNGATSVDHLTLLPGFKAELIYSVPKDTQGSWVSLATDPKGRIYASDQGGSLYRVTPGKEAGSTQVEPVDLPIGSAQGLLWYHDSLYVVINGSSHNHPAGLYRLTDTDHDDKLDKIDQLLVFKGRTGEVAGGEHGPHAVLPGPDGKLYVVAGNFTSLPDPILPTSPAAHWAEDALLQREPDGRGHDPTIWAPGGWVCRMDPDGTHVEAFATGLRNSYDIAFNPDGELFTFDSDMEWDIGAPWYRPTRICHLVSGSEWGWRNGSAKWPTYYPDSVPPVVDIGLGSPTGVVFGTQAKFPAKYQHAFFANDWAYGKIFAVHLKPDGSSYSATFEPFVVGKPFDVTDIVVNPADGAMYVAIGGRSTQSGLYRITYTGKESTKPVPYPKDDSAAQARALRHRLEAFHGVHDRGAVVFAWPFLSHPDRFIRFAARVAIESQPVAEWQDRALAPASPETAIEALLALSRVGDKSIQPKILEALDRLDPASLPRAQRLELLRVYGVCFARMGKPDTQTLARYAARFDAGFPTHDRDLDHELAQLLVFCDSPTVVAKCIPFLASGDTQEEQLFYALTLRTMKAGWSRADRETYFKWLNMAEDKYTGGASFKPFLQHIRDHAVETLTADEKASLASVIKPGAPVVAPPAAAAKPRAFVRNWQMADLDPKLAALDHGRSFANGKAAYEITGCAKCHIFKGEGGSVGPDITGVGSRFSAHDFLESIIVPSKAVSDQYAETKVVTRNNGAITGTIQSENADQIVIRTSPLSPATETIKTKDVVRRGLSKVSPMPEGLLNTLSEDEILDLIAYVRSAANPNDKAFKK